MFLQQPIDRAAPDGGETAADPHAQPRQVNRTCRTGHQAGTATYAVARVRRHTVIFPCIVTPGRTGLYAESAAGRALVLVHIDMSLEQPAHLAGSFNRADIRAVSAGEAEVPVKAHLSLLRTTTPQPLTAIREGLTDLRLYRVMTYGKEGVRLEGQP